MRVCVCRVALKKRVILSPSVQPLDRSGAFSGPGNHALLWPIEWTVTLTATGVVLSLREGFVVPKWPRGHKHKA